jgi:hypothetical protein
VAFLFKTKSNKRVICKMNILTTSASAQNLQIIPRSFPASVSARLTNESTNTTQTQTIAPTSSNGYMTLNAAWTLKEANFYLLEVFDGVNLIYRGRVFCTNQTNFEKFTVNNNVYTQEQAGDNTFVII